MKVKTGQTVKVITGKDKGKSGKIIQVFPDIQKVVVEGANKMYKHIKKQKGNKGERVEFFGPMHVSNVCLVTDSGQEIATKDGKKVKEKLSKEDVTK